MERSRSRRPTWAAEGVNAAFVAAGISTQPAPSTSQSIHCSAVVIESGPTQLASLPVSSLPSRGVPAIDGRELVYSTCSPAGSDAVLSENWSANGETDAACMPTVAPVPNFATVP